MQSTLPSKSTQNQITSYNFQHHLSCWLLRECLQGLLVSAPLSPYSIFNTLCPCNIPSDIWSQTCLVSRVLNNLAPLVSLWSHPLPTLLWAQGLSAASHNHHTCFCARAFVVSVLSMNSLPLNICLSFPSPSSGLSWNVIFSVRPYEINIFKAWASTLLPWIIFSVELINCSNNILYIILIYFGFCLFLLTRL